MYTNAHSSALQHANSSAAEYSSSSSSCVSSPILLKSTKWVEIVDLYLIIARRTVESTPDVWMSSSKVSKCFASKSSKFDGISVFTSHQNLRNLMGYPSSRRQMHWQLISWSWTGPCQCQYWWPIPCHFDHSSSEVLSEKWANGPGSHWKKGWSFRLSKSRTLQSSADVEGRLKPRKWGPWRDLQRHHTQHRVCSRMDRGPRVRKPFASFLSFKIQKGRTNLTIV